MRLRSPTWLVLCAALAGPLTAQSPEPSHTTATTTHYALRVEGDRLEADELGRMLEEAWPVFQGFFKAQPELARDAQLGLRVYATGQRWLDALLTDRTTPPSGARLAWFSPVTRTVYVERQASEYVTRALVLYGACVQFHALAKVKNRDLDAWYVHGLAESFATHAWDGEHVKLGVSPRICVIDHPALALEALGGERSGLDAWTVERLQIPYVRWSAVRFALYGAKGKYRSRLEKLALGHTGSKVSGEDFMRSLGREKSIASEFHEWLVGAQMPFEAVRGDWEDLLDGRIVARPAAGRIAIACARKRFDELVTAFDPPRDRSTSIALVLRLVDAQDYTLLHIKPPGAFLEQYRKDELMRTEPFVFDGYGPGPIAISARRDGQQVSVRVDGRDFGPFEVESARLGLAVLGGSVVCRGLEAR